MDDTDENKEISKKYEKVWEGVKKEVEIIHGGERVEYGKGSKKIKFESDDNLPMNKPMTLRLLTITIRCVFIRNFFRWSFVWVSIKMLQYQTIEVSEGTDGNKTSASKECELCHYCFFKDVGFKFEAHVCNKCHNLLLIL